MDFKSNRSSVTNRTNKKTSGKPVFDAMVNEFSTNAYTSKGLNLALNVMPLSLVIFCDIV